MVLVQVNCMIMIPHDSQCSLLEFPKVYTCQQLIDIGRDISYFNNIVCVEYESAEESLLSRINSCFQCCGLRQGSKIHPTTCVCVNSLTGTQPHPTSFFFFNILPMTAFMLQAFAAETRGPAKDIYHEVFYRKSLLPALGFIERER